MKGITKKIFLGAQVCMAQGWFLRREEFSSPPTGADQFRMEQGAEIGRLARTLYPTGVYVPPGAGNAPVRQTQKLMADAKTNVLFEATFRADDFIAKADIIKRQRDGWHVVEVKMSLEDTKQMTDLVDDLTYTVMVARRSGVKVNKASLMLIARKYRKGMDVGALFVELDKTPEVEQRLAELEGQWAVVQEQTSASKRPEVILNANCRSCDLFCSSCIGVGIKNSVINLPNLRKDKIAALAAADILEMSDIPLGFSLSDTQQRIVDCTKSGNIYVGKSLREELEAIEWPAYYLDFETVMTALPLYPGLAPFEQVVTQYSVHKCESLGKVTGHYEYLADASRDCQRELVERLIQDLGNRGSIIVYSSFEKTRIGALAQRFPDLAGKQNKLKDRLFDLLSVIRAHYYHPDFGGSYSIKSTLPAVVPELSYADLDIGDGSMAIAAFARMALGQYTAEVAQKVRVNLLKYCERDTLAMVRLHEGVRGAEIGCHPAP